MKRNIQVICSFLAFLAGSFILSVVAGAWQNAQATYYYNAAPAGGGGSVTFVGVTNGTEESDGSQNVTRTLTAGNCVVIIAKWEDATGVGYSFSDTVSNTYTAVGTAANQGGNCYVNAWYAKNITGGTNV